MILYDLLEGVCCDRDRFENLEIENLTISSKDKKKNSLYFCLSGRNFDGHDFVDEAVLNGARVVVCERKLKIDVPQILVKNSRKALSIISANFFGRPAEKLKIVAVTGTNGKTSTTYIIKSILEKNGKKCGLVGTNGVFVGKKKIDENLTTPDPILLHSYFRQMVDEGCEFAVIEASAHAIFWNKLYGIKFECVAFTNLTQDHLDFFGTMENYANVKMSFFNEVCGKNFVVNVDDAVGQEIAGFNLKNLKTYSIEKNSDFHAKKTCNGVDGLEFALSGMDEKFESNLIGKFNLYNCVCAVGVCFALGMSKEEIAFGLKEKNVIPGRFNIFEVESRGSRVIIDFAHTPDGLEKALKVARSVCKGKLICVFGCGGNRDKTKRNLMGKVALGLADLVFVTSDNPRFEKPLDIIKDVTRGMEKEKKIVIKPDRAKAIFMAILKSGRGDVVLVAGKGAEKYQEICGEKKPFSDEECVLNFIKKTE